MDGLREWLLGVIACALLVGAVGQICPEGAVRKLVRFTGALLMLLTMLRPLAGPALADLVPEAAAYREAVARAELELADAGEKERTAGIAARLDAYIEDKAESLGASVDAKVELERHAGALAVGSVTLRGGYCEALAEWIVSELGVAKEDQIWVGEACGKD